jgi:sulfite oxidase
LPAVCCVAAAPRRAACRRGRGCGLWGPQHLKFPGKNEGLVVLGEKPLVAETPESLLDDDITPIEKILHPQQRTAEPSIMPPASRVT